MKNKKPTMKLWSMALTLLLAVASSYSFASTKHSTSPKGKFCANENGHCAFKGEGRVFYGAKNKWVSKKFTNGASCSNGVFGDPIHNVVKKCYVNTKIKSHTSPQGEFCANENGHCSFTGKGHVFYGAQNKWFSKKFKDGASCSNAVFGDPIHGVVKKCYVKKKKNYDLRTLTHTRSWGRHCAKEGQYCSFNVPARVYYGVEDKWISKAYKNGGGVNCNNHEFGDPRPNLAKSCYVTKL